MPIHVVDNQTEMRTPGYGLRRDCFRRDAGCQVSRRNHLGFRDASGICELDGRRMEWHRFLCRSEWRNSGRDIRGWDHLDVEDIASVRELDIHCMERDSFLRDYRRDTSRDIRRRNHLDVTDIT